MSIETPTPFDPLAKTNLFDFILSDELYLLKNTKIEKSTISIEEYETKYHIPIPESLINTWKKNTWLYFNRICDDLSKEHYARNEHIQVHAFIFSLENKYGDCGLYEVIKSAGSKSVNQLIENEKPYLQNCFRACGHLLEEFDNNIYQETFYFDAFGNIDSVRFLVSLKTTKNALTTLVKQLLERKVEFSDHLKRLDAAQQSEIDKNNQIIETARRQRELKIINHPVFGEYIERLPKCLYGIYHEIEYGDHEWQVHEGDLIINGDWQPDNIALIITGNLYLSGLYDGYSKGFSFIVVLGDMTAANLVCWYGLSVAGNLKVNGMINIEHYCFPFEVAGDLQARHLSIHHSDRTIHWNNLYVESAYAYNLEVDPKSMLKNIAPALLVESITDKCIDSLHANFSATVDLLLRKEPVFRQTELSDAIVEKILFYSENGTESQEVLAIDMQLDPLLALTIANYHDVSAENLRHLESYQGKHGDEFDKAIQWTLENQV
jgi:hypothetical protein